jgi:hypothetical protein
MTPPYAITFEHLTKDIGPIKDGTRKIDARHYNGYLITPGIVYHLAAKVTDKIVTDRYGNKFETGIINFITRFGNYMRKGPYVKIHGAYSYVCRNEKEEYLNACTGNNRIIPVTMFLVMLYNACFMYQNDKSSNILIKALDTFDLGTSVDIELFLDTLSE